MSPNPKVPRRRLSPALVVVVDVLRNRRASGGWLVPLIILLTVLAAAVASVGQVVPWLIYPAL